MKRTFESWKLKPAGPWFEQDAEEWANFTRKQNILSKIENHFFSCLGRKFKREYKTFKTNLCCYQNQEEIVFLFETEKANNLYASGYALISFERPRFKIEFVDKIDNNNLNDIQKRALFCLFLNLWCHLGSHNFYDLCLEDKEIPNKIDVELMNFFNCINRREEFLETAKRIGAGLGKYYDSLTESGN